MTTAILIKQNLKVKETKKAADNAALLVQKAFEKAKSKYILPVEKEEKEAHKPFFFDNLTLFEARAKLGDKDFLSPNWDKISVKNKIGKVNPYILEEQKEMWAALVKQYEERPRSFFLGERTTPMLYPAQVCRQTAKWLAENDPFFMDFTEEEIYNSEYQAYLDNTVPYDFSAEEEMYLPKHSEVWFSIQDGYTIPSSLNGEVGLGLMSNYKGSWYFQACTLDGKRVGNFPVEKQGEGMKIREFKHLSKVDLTIQPVEFCVENGQLIVPEEGLNDYPIQPFSSLSLEELPANIAVLSGIYDLYEYAISNAVLPDDLELYGSIILGNQDEGLCIRNVYTQAPKPTAKVEEILEAMEEVREEMIAEKQLEISSYREEMEALLQEEDISQIVAEEVIEEVAVVSPPAYREITITKKESEEDVLRKKFNLRSKVERKKFKEELKALRDAV